MSRKVALFLLPLLFGSFAAPAVAGSVEVWKYSGKNFLSVKLLSLYRKETGDWSRSATVAVDELGLARYSPYSSIYNNPSPTTPSEWGGSNPVIEEIHAQRGSAHNQSCSLLLLNQSFPINVMRERKVISEGLSKELLHSSLELDPDQVTFIEATQTYPEILIKRKLGEIPSNARETENPLDHVTGMSSNTWQRYMWSRGERIPWKNNKERKAILKKMDMEDRAERRQRSRRYYDVKSASVLLISGQTPQGMKSLPFEKHSTQVLEKKLDRKQFPHVWELGRAAQLEKGKLNEVLEAALLQIQSEAALLGVDLDKAHIFAHALDEQHARLYEKVYGLTPFSRYVGDSEGLVLSISVADFMKRLKMKNTLSGQAIEPGKLQAALKRVEKVHFTSEGGLVQFRDFSAMNAEAGWISPAMSKFEKIAQNKGAHSPNFGERSGRSSYDGLDSRMYSYYQDSSKAVREREARGIYENERLLEQYFLRSRFIDLNAWVMDVNPALSQTGVEVVNGEWKVVEASASTLKTALSLADEAIRFRKSTLASGKEPSNVVFVVRGGVPDTWKGLIEVLSGTKENIYFDPVVTHGTRGFGPSHTSGGDSMDLVSIPFAKVQELFSTKTEKERAALKKLLGFTKKLEERHWSEPLPGT